MNTTTAITLDIPGLHILSTRKGAKGEMIIEVESTPNSAICHRCGVETHEFHSLDRPIMLRHLPHLGQMVLLEICLKRYQCPHCTGNPTTTQQPDWYESYSPHTRAYDAWLLHPFQSS